MPLTPQSGSSTTQSRRNDVPHDIASSQSDLVPQMPFVSDSALNKFAIDPSQYPNTTKLLVGFMKGKRVLVTYYRQLHREGVNNRTNIADLPSARHNLHSEFQKIINLEITLPKGLDFTANNSTVNMTLAGQAMFYPNMNPSIGDLFMMGIGDGRIGVCRISSVTPTNWRSDRIYIVDFVIQEFADSSNHEPIESSVTITSYFRKENYLGGTAALLSEDTYLHLAKIKTLRTNLCRFYHQSFFDLNLCSYVRPDRIYDPWVVKFMIDKLSMDDVSIIPKNLFSHDQHSYRQTLWSRLEDRYNTSMYQLLPKCIVRDFKQTRMSVFTTELCNYNILHPYDEGELGDPYLYSANFYTGKTVDMTPEELLIYNAVTTRTIGSLGVLVTNYLDTVLSLSLSEQFYKIPLYIHLIDMALQSQYREIDAPSMNWATPGDGN